MSELYQNCQSTALSYFQDHVESFEPFAVTFTSSLHDYMSNGSGPAIIMLELPQTMEMRYLLDARIPMMSYVYYYSFRGYTHISVNFSFTIVIYINWIHV